MSYYKKLHRWFHQFASPKYFYDVSYIFSRWAKIICIVCFVCGLYGGLILAPVDYQQGDSYRIIFVHVPSAWMALFIYMVMAISGGIGLIWHIKLAEIVARNSAPIGASFTFIALMSGAIWGKPMWGAYWVWDARLTSFLILFFLYLGYIALQSAFEDRRVAARAGAILALVGLVNIPIIHYSVVWWSTLHQGSIISEVGKPTMHWSMFAPLVLMVLAFKTFYITSLLIRVRTEILEYERNSSWVKQLLRDYKNVTD